MQWLPDTSLTADLTFDGSPELVVWGTAGDSLFAVSMVECAGGHPGHVWTLALNAINDFGSRDIEVKLTDPSLGDGYLDENCIQTDTTAQCRHLRKIDPQLAAAYSRGGRGLSIGIEDHDHVYVYWDPELEKFVSWRP